MNKDQMAKTAQLDQFDEELYKVYICSFLFISFIDDLIGT